MKTLTVGEFKTRFSEALDAVRNGETVIVSFGRNHRKVAALIPYSQMKTAHPRPLGLLQSKATVRFSSDWSLTDEQFLET